MRSLFRRALSLCAPAFVAAHLISCTSMPPTLVSIDPGISPPPAELQGIVEKARGEKLVRILFIHGMGATSVIGPSSGPCTPAALIVSLTDKLHTPSQQSDNFSNDTCGNLRVPIPTPITVPGVAQSALLYTYHFAGADGPKVQFSFLLWAPMTEDLKAGVGEANHPTWSVLTTYAKSFLQTHIGDVVLYAGTFRSRLRLAVEEGMCLFTGGTAFHQDTLACDGPDPNARTVIITHSLGGYMVADAVRELAGKKNLDDTRNAAHALLARTDLFFMLANQLALLDLTTATQSPAPRTTANAQASDGSPPESEGPPVRALVDYWKKARGSLDEATKRQLVAFSDPDDLLSYLITSREVRTTLGDKDIVATNVYLGVTPTWLHLFANPYAAHLNYLTDKNVMTIMACGMAGNSIKSC